MKKFTNQQRAIIAKKMGYDGPMQGFDQFLESSPALKAKYSAVTNKYMEKMAKGGMVKRKYAVGGAVKTDFTKAEQDAIFDEVNRRAEASGRTPEVVLHEYATSIGYSNDQIDQSMGTYLKPGDTQEYVNRQAAADAKAAADAQAAADAKAAADARAAAGVTGGGAVKYDSEGVPLAPAAASMTAATIGAPKSNELVGTSSLAPDAATQTSIYKATLAADVAAPAPITTSTVNASTATPAMQTAMDGVNAAQGAVSQDAQVAAQTQSPTTTQVGTVQPSLLGLAQTVQGAPTRTAQAGEMVSSGVDMAAANQLAAQTAATAAQGTVTDKMTVQGQLSTLTDNFDASNPPSWAAGAVRAANVMLASRGLSASSMAGQAIVQAAMESALPIASADAQAFQQMASQNLSNRQQSAVLAAQQRAQFMGQEFDQAFQTKVINASKVSDIANMNFSAQQQVVLENARMAQTVDLANLNNKQAVVMAEVAQIASLETTNLNNRQQAAVVNAQNFLQMDITNLNNSQQTSLFKAQQISQALLTDVAAENAAKQFNSSSQNQTDQFMATMTTQVNQFNNAQQNALSQFNTDQVNALSKFNVEQVTARQEFNSQNRLVIDQSNAQWRREISTADTASINAANYLNAQNLQQMTVTEYNNQSQFYRDQIANVFQAYENEQERIVGLAKATIAGNTTKEAAQTEVEGDMWNAVGAVIAAW